MRELLENLSVRKCLRVMLVRCPGTLLLLLKDYVLAAERLCDDVCATLERKRNLIR